MPDDTNTLLKEVSADVSSVIKNMLAADQRDGYEGEYTVTVDVNLTLVRARKGANESSAIGTLR